MPTAMGSGDRQPETWCIFRKPFVSADKTIVFRPAKWGGNTTKARSMLFIENEGALFRGFARAWPQEIWDPRAKRFVPYKGDVPKDVTWGQEISNGEAEAFMRDEDSGRSCLCRVS